MTIKSLALHPRADLDIEDVLSHYQKQSAYLAGIKFLTELEKCFNFVKDFPDAGSVRIGHLVGRADIRTWPMRKFPFLLIYKATSNQVNILRVLHQRRDIPRWLLD